MASNSVTPEFTRQSVEQALIEAEAPDTRTQPSGVHYLREIWDGHVLGMGLANRLRKVDECLKASIAIQRLLQQDRIRTEMAADGDDEYVYSPMMQADVDGLELGLLMLLGEAENCMQQLRDNDHGIAQHPLREGVSRG